MRKLIKPILSIGVFASAVVPTSCSTMWMHWNVDKDNTEYEAALPQPEISEDNLWKVRPMEELRTAYDASNETVDLSLLNNQYEVETLIAEIIKMNTGDLTGSPDIYGNLDHTPDGKKDPIDYYWKSGWLDGEYNEPTNLYKEMQIYLNNLVQTSNLRFLYGSSNLSHSFSWDLTTSVNGIPTITEAIDAMYNYEGDPSTKGYDVEASGITDTSQPEDLASVTAAAEDFMNNPIVSTILGLDEAFCLRMAKLANLPKTTFDAFNGILLKIDTEMTEIFHSDVFNEFVTNKNIEWKISQYDGTKNFYKYHQPIDLFKGIFILSAIGAE